MKKKITVSIPCYNEEENIKEVYRVTKRVLDTLDNYDYEILFVNDKSTDNTLDLIKELKTLDNNVAYIDLARNYGKEIAMSSIFKYAKGDCLVILDADLQYPPKYIPEMVKYWEEGYQDVYGKRMKREGENIFKKSTSKLYYYILNKLSDTEIISGVGDFRLLDRVCIDALAQYTEHERYTKGLFSDIGFKKKEFEFNAEERFGGETKWSFSKLFDLAINGITSHTVKPLRLATYSGLVISMLSFIYLIFTLVKTIIFGADVDGYPSLLIVILFLGGIQLIFLGVIGEYLGKIFIETKNRNLYFVQEYSEDNKK